MDTAYKGQTGSAVLQRATQKWLRICLDAAGARLTSSVAMAQEFRCRYGGAFEPIMQSVEEGAINRMMTPPPARSTVRFTFTGAMAPNRWRPLQAIGQALLELRAENVNGELVLYSLPEDLEAYGKAFESLGSAVRVAGTAAPGEVAAIQRDADVLVHAEAFDDDTRRYTRLSFSTKIPQYLAAGRCVFAYGPAESASIRYIGNSCAGIAESGESSEAIRNALRRIIESAELRERAGRAAVEMAIQFHDASRQRERFRQVLLDAATPGAGRSMHA